MDPASTTTSSHAVAPDRTVADPDAAVRDPASGYPAAPLTVAAVQAEAVPGDLVGNVRTAARLVGAAQARLVVLPELFLCAYDPPLLYTEPDRTDLSADGDGQVDDPRLDPLRQAAEGRSTVLVGASVRHPDGRRTCSLLVVDPTGAARAGYHKQHLWGPDENELFTPGERGTTVVVEGWRVALGICYDGCFPEHGRAGARHGAHALCYPSGYVTGSEHRRDLYYRARALDNTAYVAFANLVGGTDPWRFNGGAALYDPQGQPLRKAPDEGEAVARAVFEPGELARVRAAHTMLADLRGDQGPQRLLLAG